MGEIDFINKMLTRYQRRDGSNREELISYLDVFCKKCPEQHYNDIYEHCIQHEKYFNINKIFDYARSKNYVSEKQSESNVVYWNICNNCNTKYSKHGRGCPKCKSPYARLETDETLPDTIIEVQEDCYYCTIYKESVKKENERKLYFQGCNDYGKKQDAQCKACECQECCRQMMMYNADPKGTTSKYKTTELAQPWIAEAPPLGETVKQMVDDIKKNPSELEIGD